MKEEEWRDIAGYEGLYQVSDQGRVRSLPRDVINGRGGLHHLPQRVLKPAMNRYGYLQVLLYKDGKRKLCLVHRLVAQAFLDNAEGLPEVNHIDENKQNNAVTNLEYCSRVYNMRYGTAIARRAAANTNGKCSKAVQQFSKDGELIAVWPSTHEAERATGVNYRHICECCNGDRHTAGGYKWQYA